LVYASFDCAGVAFQAFGAGEGHRGVGEFVAPGVAEIEFDLRHLALRLVDRAFEPVDYDCLSYFPVPEDPP